MTAQEQEWWGVAIGIKEEYQKHKIFVKPYSSRLIEMSLRMSGPPLVIMSSYEPHVGRPIEGKDRFWELL